MFALVNLVMKGILNLTLSHPDENSIKDFSSDSCVIKEKKAYPTRITFLFLDYYLKEYQYQNKQINK